VHEDDPRIPLAIERTLLAWIRTGLSLMGFGFVVARLGLFLRELALARGQSLAAPKGTSLLFGAVLLVLGGVMNLSAAAQYRRRLRQHTGIDLPPTMQFAVAIGAITGFVGIVLAVYLLRS
jgi:putative membrane protein